MIDLSALRIAPCVGCFGCWTRTPGRCVIRDDAVQVYPKIAAARRVLYVSRLFCGGYDLPMKTMLERAIPIQQAFIRLVDGETHHFQRRVEYDVLYDLVLHKIQECARAALRDEAAVAGRLSDNCIAEGKAQREAMEHALAKDEERVEVLDKMVLRLYEDMVAGRISEANFNLMLDKTQTEQAQLKERIAEGHKKLADELQLASDARQWTEAIRAYADITELDAATINRLVKEIVVHEQIDPDRTRHITIEIHFNLKPIAEAEQVTA